jgi:hypothetical protein
VLDPFALHPQIADAEVPAWLVGPIVLVGILVLVASIANAMMPARARMAIRLTYRRLMGQMPPRQPCVKCGAIQRVQPYAYWIAKTKPSTNNYSGVRNLIGWVCQTCAAEAKAGTAPHRSGLRWPGLVVIALVGVGVPIAIYATGKQHMLDSPGVEIVRTGPFQSIGPAVNFLNVGVMGGAAVGLMALVYLPMRALRHGLKPGGKVALAAQRQAFLAQGFAYGGQNWPSEPENEQSICLGGDLLDGDPDAAQNANWDRLDGGKTGAK